MKQTIPIPKGATASIQIVDEQIVIDFHIKPKKFSWRKRLLKLGKKDVK